MFPENKGKGQIMKSVMSSVMSLLLFSILLMITWVRTFIKHFVDIKSKQKDMTRICPQVDIRHSRFILIRAENKQAYREYIPGDGSRMEKTVTKVNFGLKLKASPEHRN